CFRNEGISPRHNPEFTQDEIYHAFGDYHTMMELTESVVQFVCTELELPEQLPYGQLTMKFATSCLRIPYLELFAKVTGLAPDDVEAIRKRALELKLDAELKGPVELRNDIFEKVVEETLIDPTFVIDYPVELCPLAKTRPDDPTIAERFELFVGGMEVANGYSELNDPAEQERRFAGQLADSTHEWAALDADYVRALEYGMPPAGGLGIGIDRLVMLLVNVRNIRDVVLFPLMRPTTGADVVDNEPS
ncbi:MAG: lysine--tRNA ligase, partial [Candidatus Cloacimonetes bacterium]|nr:lysine--tRNA ligase [Candidatus Cloacimonadota bacterium]